MEYTLDLAGRATGLESISAAIAELDPATLVDIDPCGCTIRIATILPHDAVMACLMGVGVDFATARLRQLPSVCCGGCSG